MLKSAPLRYGLSVLAVVIGGCLADEYPFRDPCDASDNDCCPPHSHEVAYILKPRYIICASDEDGQPPDADAGGHTDVQQEGGADAP